jgi:hypothetical protein
MKHTPWIDKTPKERFEALAWSVSVSCAIETGEEPTVIYERMIKRYKENLVRAKEKLEGAEH